MDNHTCCHCHKGHCHEEHEESSWKECVPMLISALLLGSGLLLSHCEAAFFTQSSLIPFIWYLLAYLPVGLPVMKEAWESIEQKDFFSEFLLMTIATLGAFAIGEYPEGVSVMLFYCIGELLQDKAVDKARGNISALVNSKPDTTEVIRNGQTLTVAPQEVEIGETIQTKPGERVSLDGILLDEEASFNTSALTGESIPRHIKQGEEVLAGMIAESRAVRIRVNKTFDNSALSRIIDLVQNASERKAPAELFIRRFARVYTPIVIGLAVAILVLPMLYALLNAHFHFVFSEWLYKSLIFLVLSCPCALVISIPLGYFGGIGAASRKGILFKGGNYLDAITGVNTVVFDKTGTLTKGNFEVQRCSPASSVSEDELLKRIVAVEKGSTHPIAKAIVRYAEKRNIVPASAESVTEVAGFGLKAAWEGEELLIGNARLLAKYGISYPESLNTETDTLVACAANGQYMGYVTLADVLKDDAREAIARLKALRIRDIEMLSGDKQTIVDRMAKELGIKKAYGDLLPDGKVNHIEKLRKDSRKRIAFVGDGMNDAPVLALSHVGIAMGGLGSDAAIETADVVIQTDQPSKVAVAIGIGKQTQKIIRQNICLAFGVKLMVLLLGALGMATLWEAVFADVGVTLLAVLNAMRLQKLVRG